MTEEIKDKEMTDEEKQKLQQQQFIDQMDHSFKTDEFIFLKTGTMLLDGYLLRVAKYSKVLSKDALELLKPVKETLANTIANFEKQFAKKETKEEKPEGKDA